MLIATVGNKRIWLSFATDWVNPGREFVYFRANFHFETNPLNPKVEGIFFEVGLIGMRFVLGIRIK